MSVWHHNMEVLLCVLTVHTYLAPVKACMNFGMNQQADGARVTTNVAKKHSVREDTVPHVEQPHQTAYIHS